MLWPAALCHLGRIENREMFANNLAGCISFDSLGAGVPAGDLSFGIEYEDGVIPDGLYQKTKDIFAVLKALLGPALPVCLGLFVMGLQIGWQVGSQLWELRNFLPVCSVHWRGGGR